MIPAAEENAYLRACCAELSASVLRLRAALREIAGRAEEPETVRGLCRQALEETE